MPSCSACSENELWAVLTHKDMQAVLLQIFQIGLEQEINSQNRMLLNFSRETVYQKQDHGYFSPVVYKHKMMIRNGKTVSSAWVVTKSYFSYWSPGKLKPSQPSDTCHLVPGQRVYYTRNQLTLKSNQPYIQHLVSHICATYD